LTAQLPFALCCLAGAALSALLYGIGLLRLWSHAGIGRGATTIQAIVFLSAWLAAAFPVLSPLHSLGTSMFSMHMIEHELLIGLAAPLFVLAKPGAVLAWCFSPHLARFLGRLFCVRSVRSIADQLSRPVTATILHAAALWIWHLPVLFQPAVFNSAAHLAQHLSFFFSGIFFWRAVLSRNVLMHRPAAAVFGLFATAMQTSLLGALLTFSPTIWYPAALDPFPLCGLTRLEDQQLAGLIMWIPGAMPYLVAVLWILGRKLSRNSGESRYATYQG
jgi:cytochrome c oxidase assembly factor CtaG